MPAGMQQVAALGVGRIPLESLADASVLFARGLLRAAAAGRAAAAAADGGQFGLTAGRCRCARRSAG